MFPFGWYYLLAAILSGSYGSGSSSSYYSGSYGMKGIWGHGPTTTWAYACLKSFEIPELKGYV